MSAIIESKFRHLADALHFARHGRTLSPLGLLRAMVISELISMGSEIVPLILGETTFERGDLLIVLKAITGQKQIDAPAAWLAWGAQNGYTPKVARA